MPARCNPALTMHQMRLPVRDDGPQDMKPSSRALEAITDEQDTDTSPLVPGAIYAFRTPPFGSSAKPDTGRYAALKIIAADEQLIVVATLEGVWPMPPSLDDVRDAGILENRRFSFDGELAVLGVDRSWWTTSDLADFSLLGHQPLSPAERQQADIFLHHAPGSRYSVLRTAGIDAEGEWRWANDHETLLEEHARDTARWEAERQAREARYRQRLKGLTLDSLMRETPFERWTPSPPFPPEDFTLAARWVVHDACERLRALGSKPRKPAVRRILRDVVEWFNEADKAAGEIIETEEREDICAILEEMAHAAKQPELAAEVDDWRDW